MAKQEKPVTQRGRSLLALVYGLAAGHVLVVFTVGEPYPSLQGPMFAGHMQEGRIVHVPFYREDSGADRLPSHEKVLRHETLAIPMQTDPTGFAPRFPGHQARQFLIGHSLRTPWLRSGDQGLLENVNWSTYKIEVPWNAPPSLRGEEDLIND